MTPRDRINIRVTPKMQEEILFLRSALNIHSITELLRSLVAAEFRRQTERPITQSEKVIRP